MKVVSILAFNPVVTSWLEVALMQMLHDTIRYDIHSQVVLTVPFSKR